MTQDSALNASTGAADRGIPSVGHASRSKFVERLVVTALGAAVIAALVAVNGGFAYFASGEEEPDKSPVAKSKTIANHLGPAPEPPRTPEPLPEIVAEAPEPVAPSIIRTGDVAPPPHYPRFGDDQENKKPTPEERKRSSGLLAFSAEKDRGPSQTTAGFAVPENTAESGDLLGGDRADGLEASLKPAKLEGARAGLLVDRDMFVTRGAFLDCALETAINSDVAGMTSCRLTRDVYGASGKVKLLERGSRVTGQYASGLERGKARIFVLWNRAETPNGVIVELDSPGTDALGRSGHDGYVDTHFWERFGGAIMLSLIDDVGSYVAAKAGDVDSGTVRLDGTSDSAANAAGVALENSVNIRPTLVKHQGEHINVFVARDLDFRGVYALEADDS
jgi:type IV secretion system protein VirB10